MDVYVELYDLRSGNLMATFADEREAWEDLRRMALKFGLDEIGGLGMAQIRGDDSTLIAMEDELVRRVASELRQADDESAQADDKTIERVAS